jgi:molecular chaperone IbpA
MRPFDLTPLYRSTIGFDHLASMLDSIKTLDGETNTYPPYNIERLGEHEYRISMAVAGFGQDDINIELKENALTVRGENKGDDKDKTFLHRGIATRTFERRFQLADHVEVTGADLVNGLLHVDLKRELPEAMKPRTITIGESDAQQRVIETAA